MDDIRGTVKEFVLNHFSVGEDSSAITDDTNLRESGILDSFSTLDLVSFIEEHFQVRLELADFESDSLYSIENIERLVRSRRASGVIDIEGGQDHHARISSQDLVEDFDLDRKKSAAFTDLYRYFKEVAQETPEGLAIIHGESRFTYQELVARTDALHDALVAAGVQPHDRVALILKNTPGFIIAVLAVWKLGAVLFPFNPLLPEEDLLKYFLDSHPTTIITSSENRNIASFLNGKGELITHLWIYSSIAHEWLLETPLKKQSLPAVRSAHSRVEGNWPALTQYSTGTTGTPKRVTRTHEQLLGEFFSYSSVLKLTASDRVLGAIPFYHSHGLKNAAMLSLFSGATLYLVESFFPRDVARLIARERITIFPGVPFMFQHLANLPEHYDFSSLRLAFSGSASLTEGTAHGFESAYSIKIRTVYGTTETGLVCVQREPTVFDGVNRVGNTIPGVSVQIVDDDDALVPVGTEGRVKVISPFAASKYDNSAGNSDSYFDGRSYFPGDVGRMLPTGELVLSGRHRGFINVGGNKVDPAEVENVLLQIPGVSEAIVVGIPDVSSGERIKAVIVASDNISSREIRAYLMHRLAEFKLPRVIEFRKELPRSPLGKILRKHLIDESAKD